MQAIKPKKSKNIVKLELASLELFAAFYPKFYLFELTVKNRLYTLINNELGQDWFTAQLSDKANRIFSQEKELIEKRKPANFNLSGKGLLIEAGLGLWVEFFNRPLFKLTKGMPIHIFTNLPKKVKRKDIYKKMGSVKELRNLLYHSRIAPIITSGDLIKLERIMQTARDLEDVLNWLGEFPTEMTDFKNIMAKGQFIQQLLKKQRLVND